MARPSHFNTHLTWAITPSYNMDKQCHFFSCRALCGQPENILLNYIHFLFSPQLSKIVGGRNFLTRGIVGGDVQGQSGGNSRGVIQPRFVAIHKLWAHMMWCPANSVAVAVILSCIFRLGVIQPRDVALHWLATPPVTVLVAVIQPHSRCINELDTLCMETLSSRLLYWVCIPEQPTDTTSQPSSAPICTCRPNNVRGKCPTFNTMRTQTCTHKETHFHFFHL